MEYSQDTHELIADDAPKAAPGKRAENREVQVQRILDAATKCFVRSGFRGASMHDICREAEMSPGAPNAPFAGHRQIRESLAAAFPEGRP